MKIPESVKIGPINYTIKEVQRMADEQMFGQICYTESVIEVRPGLPPAMTAITLWHEMLHGMMLQGGIRDHDERILDVLAHGIVQLLENNPGLVDRG